MRLGRTRGCGYSTYRSATERRAMGSAYLSAEWREFWLKSPMRKIELQGRSLESLAPLKDGSWKGRGETGQFPVDIEV